MATKTIYWSGSSGDKITLSYSASAGDQTVSVSSDAHTGYETRTKDITFQTTAGGTVTKTLTVTQAGKDITIITHNNVAITSNEVAVGYE